MQLHQLAQLNAKIDRINFQYPYDEEEQEGGPGLGTLAAGAGAAGLVGGGLYARGRMATPYGPLPQGQGRGMFSTMKRGAGALMGDADSAYKGAGRAGAYAGGVGTALKDTVGTYKAHRANMGAGAGRAVAGAGRALLDRLKNLRYSANHSRLVQLNANIDEINFRKEYELNANTDNLMEFGIMDRIGGLTNKISPFGKSIAKMAGKTALGYGAAGAGIGGLVGGIQGATSDDPNSGFFSGAAGGALKGGLIGGTAGAGIGAAGTALSPMLSRGVAKYVSRLPTAAEEGARIGGRVLNERIRQQGYTGSLGAFSARHSDLVQLNARIDEAINFERGDIYRQETGATYVPPRKSKLGFIGNTSRYLTVDPKMAAESLKEMKFLKSSAGKAAVSALRRA